MIERFKNWLKTNNLKVEKYKEKKGTFKIEDDTFLLIEEHDLVFGKDMDLTMSDEELEKIDSGKIKFVVFEFGEKFYFSKVDLAKFNKNGFVEVELNLFRYIGESSLQEKKYSNLGVHTEYELCNGTGTSKEWAKKASFHKHHALGICDKNTLAGVLAHQLECKSAGVKSIIGETITVAYSYLDDGTPLTYEMKVYAMNENGWFNLLSINKEINIVNGGDKEYFIDENRLFELSDDLVAVFSKESLLILLDVKEQKKLIKKYKKHFKFLYFQLDSVDYFDNQTYNNYANLISNYLNFHSDKLEPILISDSYYIEPEGAVSRKYINGIGGKMTSASDEQYYKTLEKSKNDFLSIYEIDKNKTYINGLNFNETINKAIKNVSKVVENCNFEYEIGKPRIPEYEYDGDKDKLLNKLLKEGIKKKIKSNPEKNKKIKEYKKRLKVELDVILPAMLRDYFLIHWDFVNAHKKENKLVGTGRGSVGGSLLAYLLDITNVDPIKYDLLFERFLNKTRVAPLEFKLVTMNDGTKEKIPKEQFDFWDSGISEGYKKVEDIKEMRPDSLPDIDLDFTSAHRHEVKRYFENKYGDEHVVSVGTFNRLKPKSLIKGFGRVEKQNFAEVNSVSKQIKHRLKFKFSDIFEDCQKSGRLKSYVNKYAELINAFLPVFGNASVGSIHASATIITPKFKEMSDGSLRPMTVFDWMPCKKVYENKSKKWVLVSEWEGYYVDRAGLLKEDILGLTTLDKFMYIIGDIKRNRGIDVSLDDIPMDCKKTYKTFAGGFTEDIFQFNSSGMKAFMRDMKPDRLDDLIAGNALYRPGPMAANAHNDYCKIKHGEKELELDEGIEYVTEDTYGLYVFQESIMRAFVAVGFSLVEADNVRTIMKKFKKEEMAKLKDVFIEKYSKVLKNKKGSKNKAIELWNKIVAFSAYGFNKSHSAAYAIMAYWTQYLKVHFPAEFYACALHFASQSQDSEYEISSLIDEIESRGIKLVLEPPHVNKSTNRFESDHKTRSIYWSIQSIKGIGIKVNNKILDMRKEGEFESIDDFYFRAKKAKAGVGRAVVEKLILAGAFDQMYGLKKPSDRAFLLEHLFVNLSNEVKVFHEKYKTEEWESETIWAYTQKTMTGFGKVDYKKILKKLDKSVSKLYLNVTDFLSVNEKWKQCCLAGKILFIVERNSKKGKFGTVTIESNDKQAVLTIWNDVWEREKDKIMNLKKEKKLLAMTGKVLFDNYRGHNCLYSDTKITKVYAI